MSVVCTHRPKMGSSQLPNGGLPFGYHHRNNTSNVSTEGLVRPPSPHNDPILGPSESDLLESFFDGIETNSYDCDNTSFGEGLHFSDQWLDQIAPSLLGHLTSYGTQPPPDFSSTAMAGFPPANYQGIFEQNMMSLPVPPPPPPPPPPIQRQPQPQSTLHHFPQHFSEPFQHQRGFTIPVEQNQHINVRPNPKPDEHAKVAAVLAGMPMHSGHQNAYAPHMSSLSRTSFSPVPNMQITRDHTKSISQSHPIPDHNHPVQPARSNEADTFFTDMYYGSQGSTSQRPAEQPELNFGSDALFTRNQGFVPPEHESSEALEKKRLDSIREALITNSVPETRTSSPIGYTEALAPVVHEYLNGNVEEEENTVTPRRGRRKSRVKMEGEDSGDNTVPVSSNPARKRKSKGDLNGSSKSASATPGKRRKSAPSQPKQPPRENLTDAQKRENHIRSEQKRRGAIREGFDDLQYIIPTLDRPGYSKSAMLYITADWLEALITDNEEMSSSNS